MTTAYVWEDNLTVGVALIDDQHRTLIQRFNDVTAAAEASLGGREVARTLDFLVDYTDRHFTDEENLMAAHGYPMLAAHRALHQGLRDSLADVVRDFNEEGAVHPVAAAVGSLLRNWLLQHIRTNDREFASFLAAAGAKPK